MSRRLAIAAAIAAAVVALVVWWLGRDGDRRHGGRIARGAVSSSRLDVAAFREHLARRRASARILQERHARERRPQAADGRPRTLHARLLHPTCLLGPADLCASIADAVDDCDAGEVRACLAVGQYLEDAPPRPLITIVFYVTACKAGEQEACARVASFKSKEPIEDCAADPLACAWRAYRSKDAAKLDQACDHGVADACLANYLVGDVPPARERARLERACQLGSPLACDALAYRLSPSCPLRCAADEDCDFDCYPPDPAAAAAAATIACDVGITRACDDLPP